MKDYCMLLKNLLLLLQYLLMQLLILNRYLLNNYLTMYYTDLVEKKTMYYQNDYLVLQEYY